MSTEYADLQLTTNRLYRDSYRRVMTYLLIMLGVCLILVVALIMMLLSLPKPKYFATTTTGKVVPMQSLSMPVVTNHYIIQWAENAARKAYSLNFVDYQQQLQAASRYFTPQGWRAFQAALKTSGLMKNVLANKLTMSAIVYKPPVIVTRLVINGRFTWRIQVPLLITYTSASGQTKRSFVVTMDVMRMPVIEIAKGIAINNFQVGGYNNKNIF